MTLKSGFASFTSRVGGIIGKKPFEVISTKIREKIKYDTNTFQPLKNFSKNLSCRSPHNAQQMKNLKKAINSHSVKSHFQTNIKKGAEMLLISQPLYNDVYYTKPIQYQEYNMYLYNIGIFEKK